MMGLFARELRVENPMASWFAKELQVEKPLTPSLDF